jgi:hypothetical protein
VAVVVILLLIAAAGFTRRVTARGEGRGIPLVSHPVDASTAECLSCHQVGEEGMPRSHRTYRVPACLTCHQVAPQE